VNTPQKMERVLLQCNSLRDSRNGMLFDFLRIESTGFAKRLSGSDRRNKATYLKSKPNSMSDDIRSMCCS